MKYGRVYIGLVLTMCFWGSSYATSKMLVFEVPYEVAALLRFGLGALLMIGIQFRLSGKLIPERKYWGQLTLLGLVGITLFNLFFFGGLSLAPSADAGMIVPTMSPIITTLAGMLFLGEPVRAGRIAGFAVSFAGVLLFFKGVLINSGGNDGRVLGDLLLLGAAGCWAAYSILSRPISVDIGALPTVSWSLFVGSIGLLLISSPKLAAVPWASLTGRFWAVLTYVVVFPTVVAFIIWMEGIRTIGAGPATSFMFLSPVFALVMAVLIMGERLTLLQGAGGALMLCGVWLVNRSD